MGIAGWPMVGWCAVALAALVALVLGIDGTGEEGIRAVIRLTARTSIALFMLAYAASSLRAFWRTPATKWLLANRRYVGVSFAVSHSLHLLFIVLLYQVSEEFRRDLSATTVIFGGLAYVFMAAMTATSSDRAYERLGRRSWKALHTAGMHWIWFIFLASYLPRALQTPGYVPFAALLIAGAGLRIAARLRQRQSRPALVRARGDG